MRLLNFLVHKKKVRLISKEIDKPIRFINENIEEMEADKKKSNFRSKKKKDVKALNKKKKVMDMTLNRHEQYSRSNYLLESQY